MSIRSSFIGLLVVCIVSLMICHISIMVFVWLPKMREIDAWNHGQVISHLEKLYHARTDALLVTAEGFAHSGAMYEALQAHPIGWQKSLDELNLASDLAARLNVDFILIISSGGEQMFLSQSDRLRFPEDTYRPLIQKSMHPGTSDWAGIYKFNNEKLCYTIAAPIHRPMSNTIVAGQVLLGFDINFFLEERARLTETSQQSGVNDLLDAQYHVEQEGGNAGWRRPQGSAALLSTTLEIPTFSEPEKPTRISIYTHTRTIKAFRQQAPTIALAAASSWILLAITLYAFVNHKVLRNFEALTKKAQALSLLDRPDAADFALKGAHEVALLSQAFARLLNKWKMQNAELESALLKSRRSLHNLHAVYDEARSPIFILDGTAIISNNMAAQQIFAGVPHEELLAQLLKTVPNVSGNDSEQYSEVLVAQVDGPRQTTFAVRRSEVIWDDKPCILVELADITDIRKFQAEAERLNRNELLGTFCSGITHDFNNILHGVSGYVEIMRATTGEPLTQAASLDALNEITRKGTALIKRILQFASGTRRQKSLVNFFETVEAAVLFSKHLLPPGVRVEFERCGEAILWRGSDDEIMQIVMNLLTNASDAMSKQGQINVCVSSIQPDWFTLEKHEVKSSFAWLVVSDSGPGIPEAAMALIFERFYTTKADSGTGIGLSTIRTFVEEYGGVLKVCNRPGACFAIGFPSQPMRDLEVTL